MGGYHMTSKNGYDFFEVASAFQKSVRRGLEEEAFYWGIELFEGGYPDYTWKRMLVMASEDVGLAEPHLATDVWCLYQTALRLNDKKGWGGEGRLQWTQALLALVRAEKSRLVDWALMFYWETHDQEHLEIPDYALDQHTRRGKSMGRGASEFYHEGSLLENHTEQPGEQDYKDKWYEAQSNGVHPTAGTADGALFNEDEFNGK